MEAKMSCLDFETVVLYWREKDGVEWKEGVSEYVDGTLEMKKTVSFKMQYGNGDNIWHRDEYIIAGDYPNFEFKEVEEDASSEDVDDSFHAMKLFDGGDSVILFSCDYEFAYHFHIYKK